MGRLHSLFPFCCLNEKIVCFPVSKLFCSVCICMDLVLFLCFCGHSSFSVSPFWSSQYHKEATTFEIIICFFQVPQSTMRGHSFLYDDNLSTGFVSWIPSICSYLYGICREEYILKFVLFI